MTKELVLKRNKYGINLILDKDTPFPKLLEAITEKFKETGTFFKDAKMAVSFEGRELTPEEEQRILDVITANSSIQIVCVMENGTALEEKMKARIEAREAEAANSYPYIEAENAGADFYKGNLRPDKEKGGRGLRKRESTAANAYSPQIATAKEGTICIEPVTRGRLNNLF